MPFTLTESGGWERTTAWLRRMQNPVPFQQILEQGGQRGVDALATMTPQDTGKTSVSWEYRITSTAGKVGIEWYNTNVVNGVVVALMIQYGHGTGTGGYVAPNNYINPAMRPVFEEIQADIMREVLK